jgi:hypothetical protein
MIQSFFVWLLGPEICLGIGIVLVAVGIFALAHKILAITDEL